MERFTEDMKMQSRSGFCMPFEADEDVEILAQTDEKIVFEGEFGEIYSVADGVVTGIGDEAGLGLNVKIRHGRYSVRYGGLAEVNVSKGEAVEAGDVIGIGDDLMMIEVEYLYETIDPAAFLAMLYENVRNTTADAATLMLESLMADFFPSYLDDVEHGRYVPSVHTEQSLRHLFNVGSSRGCFFEKTPTMANPLGLGGKADPLIGKAERLLTEDFIRYLSDVHGILVDMPSYEVKKKN